MQTLRRADRAIPSVHHVTTLEQEVVTRVRQEQDYHLPVLLHQMAVQLADPTAQNVLLTLQRAKSVINQDLRFQQERVVQRHQQ